MRERKRDGSSKLKRGAVVTCQTLSFRVDCSETSFTRTTNKELFIGGFLYHVNLINDYGLIMLVKPMRKQEAFRTVRTSAGHGALLCALLCSTMFNVRTRPAFLPFPIIPFLLWPHSHAPLFCFFL